MIVVILLIIILFGIAVKKVFDIRFSTRDSAKLDEVYTIPSVNYSNVLKAVHDILIPMLVKEFVLLDMFIVFMTFLKTNLF